MQQLDFATPGIKVIAIVWLHEERLALPARRAVHRADARLPLCSVHLSMAAQPGLDCACGAAELPVWVFAVPGNETFSIQALAWHLQDLGWTCT